MGFGFNLLFMFILAPLTLILLLGWAISAISGESFLGSLFGNLLGILWAGIFGFILIISSINWFFSKTILDHEDYRGTYVISRDYFEGKQTDWQYNHFRFEITKQDSIFFHVTEGERIVKTYRGIIRTTNPKHYASARLIVQMDEPTHHIVMRNPTTYRGSWSFYLVFYSPQYHNLFFEKGRWKPI